MIDCKDIFNYEDKKELVKLVFQYFIKNIQGKNYSLKFIKDIRFTRKSINEIIHRGSEKIN
jgi:hypothetical protein